MNYNIQIIPVGGGTPQYPSNHAERRQSAGLSAMSPTPSKGGQRRPDARQALSDAEVVLRGE